jgi:sarcosine oxidase
MLGPADSTLIAGAERSARMHQLPFDLLDSAALRWRFPAFHHGPETVGLFEPEAGVLDPERAIEAALTAAVRAGAELRFNEPLLDWSTTDGAVSVRTGTGSITAGRLVLAAGPWMPGLLGSEWPLTVERQVMFWFEPVGRAGQFAPDGFPIWMWEWSADRLMYGFPDLGNGVKVARHHEGVRVPLADVDPIVSADEERDLRTWLAQHLPGANGRLRESAVCRYTDAPDGHFVVGPHPEAPGVLVVSPCSGHGFKFAPVIGEIVADLVTEGASRFDLAPFLPQRLKAASG